MIWRALLALAVLLACARPALGQSAAPELDRRSVRLVQSALTRAAAAWGEAKDNPMGQVFHQAASLLFGELAPYTGDRNF